MLRLLLYCTKSRYRLFYDYIDNKYRYGLDGKKDKFNALNGKIVAECDYEVEEITHQGIGLVDLYETSLSEEDLCYMSCLTDKELHNYLNGKNGYAIHIKNLNVYDKPKELSDYYRFDGVYNNINNWKYIEKAPQNMMYAYELISELDWYGTYNRHFEMKIIISIRPEWLCKILNGEKTIEVRKKVLKEMMQDG